LWFTPGYYFAPAQFAIRTGTNLKSIDDLAGKSVCVGTTTTYDDYLNGRDVGIPDSDIRVPPPQNVKVIPMATDADCVQAIQAGPTDFDAFLTSSTVVETSIAQGAPIEKLGAPVFVENLAVALDKHSPKDSRRLLDTISQLVGDMHADGTLKASSMKWFGLDRTVSP
jgi:polar amino acid transport system substrate-binding protein